MKKSFQLSAVAIAIAASGSVMADVIDTTVTPSFDTDALMSVAATTVNAGSQLFVAGQDVGSTLAQNTTDISTNTANIAQNTADISTNTANIAQNTADISSNAANITTNTNTINQEIADRQTGDAAITAGIAANVTTAQLNATNATVTGTLTASAVNIVNANSVGVPNTSTSTSGISTTQKYNAGTIAGIADDVYKITEQDPSTGTLTDKYYTKSSVVDPVTGKYTYTKVELDASQKAALPFTGNKTGQTLNDTKIEDVIASQSTINGQKVDFSNSKTRDTTVDIKGDLLQIDPVTGNRIPGQDEVANGQALSNQVKLEENRAAIGILDRDGNPQTQDEYYGVNTVKTIYDEQTKTRTSGDTTIEGDSIVLTSTTTVDGTLTGTKTTSVNASGITTGQIVVDGTDVKVTLDANTAAIAQEVTDRIQGDADTLAAANTHTDNIATALRGEAAAETVRVNGELQAASDDRAAIRTEFAAADTTLQNNIDAEAATREAADNAATTDRAAIRTEFAAADTTLQNNIDAEAATREAADNAATTDRAAIRTEFAAADTTLQNNIDAEAAIRLVADNAATTDRAAIRTEFAAADTTLQNNIDAEATTRAAADTALNTRVTNETAARQAADDVLDARVTTNTTDIATNKAAIAKEVTDRQTAITAEANARIAGDAATLKSANTYTDTKVTETLAAANAYTNTRVDQLNSRVDDVQKTAYRGIAIALAAQQAVPSIQPGQVAVFGGVGHYEGETAGSIGVVTAFTDRISASGAFGFASGNEFGGRVGVAYVFGGK